jgi:hypothetical protein
VAVLTDPSLVQCADFGLTKCCEDCLEFGATYDADRKPVLFRVRRVLSGPWTAEAEVCCRHTSVAHNDAEEWAKAEERRDVRRAKT